MTDLAPAPMRRRLTVGGVVQGVGFRPFVHALARETGLAGHVINTGAGVEIEIEGPAEAIERFRRQLSGAAPPGAMVRSIAEEELAPTGTIGFTIRPSTPDADTAVAVPPDLAVCDTCLAELDDPTDRRHRHPFITCTACGPRLTIITGLPYDRPRTTMAGFPMCDACAAEYTDPADRRHHAQPVCCPSCGPRLRYERHDHPAVRGDEAALAAVADDLRAGRIVAAKGVGGYHLLVDATDDRAVARLRARKHRPDKPFAVMVADLDGARALARVDDPEAAALTDPARPVVLLRARHPSTLSRFVAPTTPGPGAPLVGVMLPSTPLHHLLFRPRAGPPPRALVATSGNVAGEPICHDDTDARERLGAIADGFCTHDRGITQPCDDGVVRIVAGAETPLRRSRGHVPLAVPLGFDGPAVLAVGGDVKGALCLAATGAAHVGPHLGDIESLAGLEALAEGVARLTELHGHDPEVIAADLHPGYHSRRWAVDHARRLGLPLVGVQHHHAHLAALLAEHRAAVDDRVIGVVFDGTGYGHDGAAWGGEVLVGGIRSAARRSHLAPVTLPGGDTAVREPWRAAVAHLVAAGLDPGVVLATIPGDDLGAVATLARRGRGTPTTSMGRLFDAVAALVGVRTEISYEAQAAIELEQLAEGDGPAEPLRFERTGDGSVDPAPLVAAIVEASRVGRDPATIARGFHRSVADLVVELALDVRAEDGLTTVGLSGGVFQNDLLTRLTVDRLHHHGFSVLTHPTGAGQRRWPRPRTGGRGRRRRGELTCASVSPVGW